MLNHSCKSFVVVGFGPASMAVATALDDWANDHDVDLTKEVTFLEGASETRWHAGMLLPGTRINHHFLKDLATLRNPRSKFTFVNYLYEHNRLFDFCQFEGDVLRGEWSEYLKWVAAQLSDYVQYDQKVQSIEPVAEAGRVECLRVKTPKQTLTTRNLVLAAGMKPRVPELFRPHVGERVFHASQFLDRISVLNEFLEPNVLVIGSGQSAAELLVYLRDQFPHCRLYSSHRAVGFKLKDTGHTSNEIYFPQETEYFHGLSPEGRGCVLKDMESADYGNVTHEISHALHTRMYEDRVLGQSRISMLNRCQAVEIDDHKERLHVTMANVYNGKQCKLWVDAIVLATGYYEEVFPSLLEHVKPFVHLDVDGGVKVSRNYEVESSPDFMPKIYLSGMSERTHGISDTQSFSMMALKGQCIWDNILPTLGTFASTR